MSGLFEGKEMRKIILYSTKTCPKCRIVKIYFEKLGIKFEEKNIEDTDVSADLIMKNIAILSAPMLEIDGVIYQEPLFFNGNMLLSTNLDKLVRT